MEQEFEYIQLLDSYRKLKKENDKLKKVLSLENMSDLDVLINNCIKYNRKQFRKIAIELQLTDYDFKNFERVKNLIKFLENFCNELSSMTGVGE